MKNFRMLIGICAPLLAAACASSPPAPQVVTQVKTLPPVYVPVKEPCVLVSDIPPKPVKAMAPGQSTEQLAIAARIDANRAEEYYIRADTLLQSCVNPEGKDKPK
jgi:hypothetical protein